MRVRNYMYIVCLFYLLYLFIFFLQIIEVNFENFIVGGYVIDLLLILDLLGEFDDNNIEIKIVKDLFFLIREEIVVVFKVCESEFLIKLEKNCQEYEQIV